MQYNPDQHKDTVLQIEGLEDMFPDGHLIRLSTNCLNNDKRYARNTQFFHSRADVSIQRLKIGEAGLSERSPDPKCHKEQSQDHSAEKGSSAKHTTYFFTV